MQPVHIAPQGETDLQIDAIDVRILKMLQKQADLSNQDLAERVGTSTASCWRRVKALRESGILGPAVRVVTPAKVGLGLDVFCYIRMRSQERGMRASFERLIETQEDVIGCYSISGEWDYLLHILTHDVASFEEALMQRLLDHEAIANSSSMFVLRRIKHSTAIPINPR